METKNCQNCKNDFIVDEADFSFYRKIKVPAPTFCPECRMQRRMIWRNEHFLFKKKDIFGKTIFSGYHSDSPIQICSNEYWWSDERDAMKYGKDYDFSRPFFEQMKELLYSVPIPAHINAGRCINSEYTNNVGDLKDCYLCFNANDSENCLYGVNFNRMRNCVDITVCSTSESSYDIFNITDSYGVISSVDCADCVDVLYSYDCRNCQNLIGCTGLRHKNYCIFNEQYSKEKFFEIKESLNLGSYKTHIELQKKKHELMKDCPRKFMHTMKCQNVSGEYIYGSKNVTNSYMTFKGEDMRYCQDVHNAKDGYDCLVTLRATGGMYENAMCGLEGGEVKFGIECHPACFNTSYAAFCSSSSYLFGCVGLRKKEYCILNKQYTKEEYEILLPKIIAHMNEVPYIDLMGHTYKYGEFFPSEFSPHAYNETIAHEYVPYTKEEALKKKYIWRDLDSKNYTATIETNDIPDNISDVSESYLQEIIECSHKESCAHGCSKAFKVIKSELDFYKKNKIQFPRECPNCRLYQRFEYRNSYKTFHRPCMCEQNSHEHEGKCQNEFETSYSPNRPEIVYCEGCYQKEII
jgi:hypothetical protein